MKKTALLMRRTTYENPRKPFVLTHNLANVTKNKVFETLNKVRI